MKKQLLSLLLWTLPILSGACDADDGDALESTETDETSEATMERGKDDDRAAEDVSKDEGEENSDSEEDSDSNAAKDASDEGAAGMSDTTKDNTDCPTFDDTFAAIQHAIFERHGCTQDVCHGEMKAGDLDLRADVAYKNLFDVKATASEQVRIAPGLPKASFLYQKLMAATSPGSVEVAGSPMPVGAEPLTEGELEALRIWITVGAPETGSVGDSARLGSSEVVGDLLGTCLPPAESVTITPLDPPAAEEGVQVEMPIFTLPAGKELEVCFATYYDLSDQVPERYRSEDGASFYINGLTLRQDANSHHLIITNPGLDGSVANDPAFGKWICYGGRKDGESCDPLARGACGEGAQCATELRDQITCSGFGPLVQTGPGFISGDTGTIVGSQTAQYIEEPREGVYRAIPIKGFLYYNAHAFNLTAKDHPMHSRVNFYYTADRQFERISKPNSDSVFAAAGIPPFEKDTVCANHIMPLGSELLTLGSHTHKRGEHFWAENPAGEQIYESFVYSDPIYQNFEPPIAFNAENEAERTIKFCATFNNGVLEDGSPDLSMVTRASTMPERTFCVPTACTEGKLGAPCLGVEDDAACDSSPGAGDGACDACPMTPGPTTENTMFVLMPTYIQR